MNKAILIIAILAFSLTPTTLSSPVKESEDKDRELISINLGTLLGGLFGGIKNATNTTTPVANTTTPVANNTTPVTTPVANNTTPVANTTIPVANNTTPVTNTTTPVANNTAPVANNTTPVTTPVANNTTPVANTTIPVANNTDPVANNTTPVANDTTPVTNTTTPVVTPAPVPVKYARNDVNMATFPEDCLKVHNQERMEVGLNNLTWSTDLAKSAQAWAENMAKNGFRHSGKSGENIASSSYSTYTLARLLGLWTKEQNYFIVGCKYPKCSSTSAEVGHYTQMVWHSTTLVGCGFAPGYNRGYNYLCCQYYKAGNIVGQYVY